MKTLSKITSIVLSAVMLTSAAVSVPVSAVSQNNGVAKIATDYVDKSSLEYTLRCYSFTGGACFEKESYERYCQAYFNARSILDNDNATQEEVDAAEKEFLDAAENLKSADYDLSKANHYYFLGADILENHKNEYSEEEFNKIRNAHFELQAFITCQIITSQEEIDAEVEKIEAVLMEVVGDLSDLEAHFLAHGYVCGNSLVMTDEDYVGMPICTVSDYKIVPAYSNLDMPAFIDERINGYIFHGYNQYTPACYGYLAVKVETGEVIALEDALRSNIIDIDKFFECYTNNGVTPSEPFAMYLIGDCDNDGLLSIKDATEMQRSLAYDKNLNNNGAFRENPNDVNNDNAVNILDATEIQKIIVNK